LGGFKSQLRIEQIREDNPISNSVKIEFLKIQLVSWRINEDNIKSRSQTEKLTRDKSESVINGPEHPWIWPYGQIETVGGAFASPSFVHSPLCPFCL